MTYKLPSFVFKWYISFLYKVTNQTNQKKGYLTCAYILKLCLYAGPWYVFRNAASNEYFQWLQVWWTWSEPKNTLLVTATATQAFIFWSKRRSLAKSSIKHSRLSCCSVWPLFCHTLCRYILEYCWGISSVSPADKQSIYRVLCESFFLYLTHRNSPLKHI